MIQNYKKKTLSYHNVMYYVHLFIIILSMHLHKSKLHKVLYFNIVKY